MIRLPALFLETFFPFSSLINPFLTKLVWLHISSICSWFLVLNKQQNTLAITQPYWAYTWSLMHKLHQECFGSRGGDRWKGERDSSLLFPPLPLKTNKCWIAELHRVRRDFCLVWLFIYFSPAHSLKILSQHIFYLGPRTMEKRCKVP